jgi:hypothetical protein
MTPSELIADYRRLGQQDLNVLLQFIADHLYELQLTSGGCILDATDCKEAFVEMAEALRKSCSTSVPSMVNEKPIPKGTLQDRWRGICHSCGHPHKDKAECGASMGNERKCLCDLEVAS